ncbi:hypothetical protein F01_520151 [Burkholderia cenocepacia]|nr:hypothetical protein F01_520151 [Burkholderia cenocepacia]
MKHFRLSHIRTNRGKVPVGPTEGAGRGCYSGYASGEDETIPDRALTLAVATPLDTSFRILPNRRTDNVPTTKVR